MTIVVTRPLVVGASVAGSSHRRDALPCQDAFAFRIEGGRVAMAVADGLGSAARADEGARVAVDAACEALDAACDLEAAARAMAVAARAALEEHAVLEGCDLRDLACTLITVAATVGGAAAAHVGDGAAVVETDDGIALLSPPGPSEYVDEVDPITADGWEERVRVGRLETGVRAVAVLTDGCQRAALRPDGEPSAGFFAPLFSYVAESADPAEAEQDLVTLLDGAKMSEHSDDDKTLVLAVLR